MVPRFCRERQLLRRRIPHFAEVDARSTKSRAWWSLRPPTSTAVKIGGRVLVILKRGPNPLFDIAKPLALEDHIRYIDVVNERQALCSHLSVVACGPESAKERLSRARFGHACRAYISIIERWLPGHLKAAFGSAH